MSRVRLINNHLRSGVFFAVLIPGVLAYCAPSPLAAQAPDRANTATVQGFVRSAAGQAVAGAVVYLQGKSGTPALLTRTDLKGAYAFLHLSAGAYTLRAEVVGTGEVNPVAFAIAGTEVAKVDLILQSGTAAGTQGASSELPKLFDEPKFTVAGVTDPTNSGGHGSDTVRRTSEALAKDTVSLSPKPPGSSLPPPSSAAEKSMREAVRRAPASFEANQRLGKLLGDEGRAKEALPFLERASQLKPGDYENTYALAVAYLGAAEYESARLQARTLLAQRDTAGIHHLLADVGERSGDPLEAVREYQRAAEMDPSEPNVFDWAAELLLHNAVAPAIEVFSKGRQLYPRSAHMLVGLGVAMYARGSYEQATQCLSDASDLNPNDPTPYLFLGRIQSSSGMSSEVLVEKLKRFAKLQPDNALANYYYALSLWQRGRGTPDASDLAEVESLLQRAVGLDPKLGPAYLRLGIVYSDRGDLPTAIAAFEKAAAASPELEEAHFRLARAYQRNGDALKAQHEMELYEEASKKKTEEVERQRHEIRQFVYELQGQNAVSPPQ